MHLNNQYLLKDLRVTAVPKESSSRVPSQTEVAMLEFMHGTKLGFRRQSKSLFAAPSSSRKRLRITGAAFFFSALCCLAHPD